MLRLGKLLTYNQLDAKLSIHFGVLDFKSCVEVFVLKKQFSNVLNPEQFRCFCVEDLDSIIVGTLVLPRTALLVPTDEFDYYWDLVRRKMISRKLRFSHNRRTLNDRVIQNPLSVYISYDSSGTVSKRAGAMMSAGLYWFWEKWDKIRFPKYPMSRQNYEAGQHVVGPLTMQSSIALALQAFMWSSLLCVFIWLYTLEENMASLRPLLNLGASMLFFSMLLHGILMFQKQDMPTVIQKLNYFSDSFEDLYGKGKFQKSKYIFLFEDAANFAAVVGGATAVMIALGMPMFVCIHPDYPFFFTSLAKDPLDLHFSLYVLHCLFSAYVASSMSAILFMFAVPWVAGINRGLRILSHMR
ncbi:unnamed protein product [Allacma fusca]|uniref:Uncharacterized protein n=1 Tax=Allacma fusca TaxID=39272 RepID=A0A8J2PFJ0_9HEXA|nr:unnamed protein product [Allacma fusca]